jgi:hypothetical protein
MIVVRVAVTDRGSCQDGGLFVAVVCQGSKDWWGMFDGCRKQLQCRDKGGSTDGGGED